MVLQLVPVDGPGAQPQVGSAPKAQWRLAQALAKLGKEDEAALLVGQLRRVSADDAVFMEQSERLLDSMAPARRKARPPDFFTAVTTAMAADPASAAWADKMPAPAAQGAAPPQLSAAQVGQIKAEMHAGTQAAVLAVGRLRQRQLQKAGPSQPMAAEQGVGRQHQQQVLSVPEYTAPGAPGAEVVLVANYVPGWRAAPLQPTASCAAEVLQRHAGAQAGCAVLDPANEAPMQAVGDITPVSTLYAAPEPGQEGQPKRLIFSPGVGLAQSDMTHGRHTADGACPQAFLWLDSVPLDAPQVPAFEGSAGVLRGSPEEAAVQFSAMAPHLLRIFSIAAEARVPVVIVGKETADAWVRYASTLPGGCIGLKQHGLAAGLTRIYAAVCPTAHGMRRC